MFSDQLDQNFSEKQQKTLAKKGAKTAAEKAVTKTGEFAGNKAGDKIIQLLSKKQPSKTKSVTMSQPKMEQPLTDFQIAERVNRMISGGKTQKKEGNENNVTYLYK